jgi:ribosomal protein S18 acetylase RimI-like enzyme
VTLLQGNTNYTWRQLTVADYAQLEPILRANIADEAYFTLAANASDDNIKAYWFGGVANEVWVLEEHGEILGSFYQRSNHFDLGSHIANGGYMVSPVAKGRGIGRILGEQSLVRAKERGFKGMQFNFVVSTNTVAVELWKKLGFRIIGTIPQGYHLKQQEYVDAYIMFREIN